jgi:hypothetical protein
MGSLCRPASTDFYKIWPAHKLGSLMWFVGILVLLALPGREVFALTQVKSSVTCANTVQSFWDYFSDPSWSNRGNVGANDGSYATVALDDGDRSQFLQCSSFGFSLPAGATINGITVTIERKAGTASRLVDSSLKIVKGGSRTGTEKANTTTYYPTADTVASYGSATDLWGTTWAVGDINASNFGIALRVTKPGTADGAITASVDYIEITVDYTAAGACTNPNTSAITQVGSAGPTTVSSGTVSSLAFNQPAGTATGDLLLAQVTTKRTGSTTCRTVPTPAGWTPIRSDSRNVNNAGTTNDACINQYLYWKKATAATGSVTFNFSGAAYAHGSIMAYRGASATNPIFTSKGQGNTSSASITAPAVTTILTDQMLVGFFGIANGAMPIPVRAPGLPFRSLTGRSPQAAPARWSRRRPMRPLTWGRSWWCRPTRCLWRPPGSTPSIPVRWWPRPGLGQFKPNRLAFPSISRSLPSIPH